MDWFIFRLALGKGSKENRDGLVIKQMSVAKLKISVEKWKKDFALFILDL